MVDAVPGRSSDVDAGRRFCPACLSDDYGASFSRVVRGVSVRYVRCRACSALYQVTLPSPTVLAAVYDAAYFVLRGSLRGDGKASRALRECRLRTAACHLERIERVTYPGVLLDIGCGEGALLEAAAARGWSERWGLDVSGEAVDAARAFGKVTQGTLQTLRLSAGAFDVVTFCDSIEHSPDPAADLAEARRLLRPGGWLYLVTPNATHWSARLMGRRWFQLKPNEHLCLFSETALRRLLARVGFVGTQSEPATKVATPAFVVTILGTTNPVLARALRPFARLELAQRPRLFRSGDLVVMARSSST